VTELLVQNLEQYLEKNKNNVPAISLIRRIEIAEGIARGLAWFHNVNPPIVHHDLKPSNILLDKDDNPKICDFGLSCFKKDETIRNPAGSKLWSAPEVLRDEEHNEKVDVFSFAIIFWQLLIMEDLPYRDYVDKGDLDAFIHDVSMEGVRLSLEKVPVKAHSWLEKMWHDDSSKRPDMETILQNLRTLTIECTILDEDGLEFWKHRAPDSYEMEYGDFIIKFHDKFLTRTSIMMCDYLILKKIFTFPHDAEKVTIESFNNVFNWFGPMRIDGIDIIQRILDLCRHEWFQGDITRLEADSILNQKYNLANSDDLLPFLVRLSLPTEKDTSTHPATISYYSLNYEKK